MVSFCKVHAVTNVQPIQREKTQTSLENLMAGPIKPPKPPISPPNLGSKIEKSSKKGKAFGEILHQDSQKAETKAVSSSNPILEDLKAGKIKGIEAMQKMIEGQFGKGFAQHLSPEAKIQLENYLKELLESDPTLQSLGKDLERKS